MKIAMIGQKGMPAIHGGVERHVHELAVRLVERGHSVTAYSRKWYTGGKTKPVEGVVIKHTPSLHTKHFDTITYALFATVQAIKDRQEVIHYHGVGPSLVSWIPRIFAPRIRVVNTFHSIDRKHEKWGVIAKLALWLGEWASCRFAHKTIAVSRTIQQYVRDAYSRDIEYIPNGVPTYTKTKNTDTLKQFKLKSKDYIVMVSRLIPHKGAHYLIAAYQKLQKSNPELLNGKKLVIVGDGHYTDAYVSYLKNMAEGDPNVIFTGFQSGDDLKQLFSHAMLMVHPSNNEGLPITVLEGMSYGLPLLVSDIPEHRELIHDAKYNFTRSDVASLKRKLEALLTETKTKLANRGRKNRAIVAAGYNWENIVTEIESLYEKEATPEIVEEIVSVA